MGRKLGGRHESHKHLAAWSHTLDQHKLHGRTVVENNHRLPTCWWYLLFSYRQHEDKQGKTWDWSKKKIISPPGNATLTCLTLKGWLCLCRQILEMSRWWWSLCAAISNSAAMESLQVTSIKRSSGSSNDQVRWCTQQTPCWCRRTKDTTGMHTHTHLIYKGGNTHHPLAYKQLFTDCRDVLPSLMSI